jgi:hypothetical protein
MIKMLVNRRIEVVVLQFGKPVMVSLAGRLMFTLLAAAAVI